MNKLFFLLLVGGVVGSYVLLTQPVPEGTTSQPTVEAPAASVTPVPITSPIDAPVVDASTEPAPAAATEPPTEFAPVAPQEDIDQAANDEPAPIEPSLGEAATVPTIDLPVADSGTLPPLPDAPATNDTSLPDTAPIESASDAMPETASMQGYAPIEPAFQPTVEATPEAVFRDPNDLYEPSLTPGQALPTPLPAE